MFISILSIVSGVFLILLFLLMIMTDSVIVLTFMTLALLGAFNIGMGVVSLLENKDAIQPIEVYRGNTELKIETREINGEVVSCDTIVVRKK